MFVSTTHRMSLPMWTADPLGRLLGLLREAARERVWVTGREKSCSLMYSNGNANKDPKDRGMRASAPRASSSDPLDRAELSSPLTSLALTHCSTFSQS